MTKTTLIDFPCDFPIKIVGINTDLFLEEVRAITLKHFPSFTDKNLTQNTSKQSNYLAITVTVLAENQEMLDAFYKELSSLPDVKMVL